jgi:hypothetical protein
MEGTVVKLFFSSDHSLLVTVDVRRTLCSGRFTLFNSTRLPLFRQALIGLVLANLAELMRLWTKNSFHGV